MAHVINYRDEQGANHIIAVKLLEQGEDSVHFLYLGLEMTLSRINVIDIVKVNSSAIADYLLKTNDLK